MFWNSLLANVLEFAISEWFVNPLVANVFQFAGNDKSGREMQKSRDVS
jgi:hypothetical protein